MVLWGMSDILKRNIHNIRLQVTGLFTNYICITYLNLGIFHRRHGGKIDAKGSGGKIVAKGSAPWFVM